ncbi:hypothetical protein CJP74_02015 [Psittacicella melopsittaci]|uniref:Uncharacterized protein n=1 Tax=Psittacicella melopsittaci TaxID=2028576 RepID=A0A3A1Y7U5_9GAMM|nr:hypothetical protein [Psittacicella melopsittaci]RIY33386.1 hypothetical protein CJP74_02015 [Psittacicella melopsittaci]
MKLNPNYTLEDLRELVKEHQCEDFEPYAYIRFSNEAITLKTCLESLVPFFKKGIICYHEPLPGIKADASLAIAQEFIAKNPGFRLVKYPFHVIYHGLPGFYNYIYNGISRFWLLHAYSQYALLHLEELARENGDYDKAWLFKVDCDHVFSQKLLEYTKLCMQLKFKTDQENFAYFYKANIRKDVLHESVHEHKKFRVADICNGYDHVVVKLDKTAPFQMCVNRPVQGSEEEKDLNTQIYELQKFARGAKAVGEKAFLNSLHFDTEKLYYYQKLSKEKVEARFVNGAPYEQVDWQKMVDQLPEVAIDPEFFTYENVAKIFASFNYPESEAQGHLYGRDAVDLETFIHDPQYRPEVIIAEHNKLWAERDKISDPEQLVALEREHRVLVKLTSENYLPELAYL